MYFGLELLCCSTDLNIFWLKIANELTKQSDFKKTFPEMDRSGHYHKNDFVDHRITGT